MPNWIFPTISSSAGDDKIPGVFKPTLMPPYSQKIKFLYLRAQRTSRKRIKCPEREKRVALCTLPMPLKGEMGQSMFTGRGKKWKQHPLCPINTLLLPAENGLEQKKSS